MAQNIRLKETLKYYLPDRSCVYNVETTSGFSVAML